MSCQPVGWWAGQRGSPRGSEQGCVLTPWTGGSPTGPSEWHGERGWWHPGDSAMHPRRRCRPKGNQRHIRTRRVALGGFSSGRQPYLVLGDFMGHQLLQEVEVYCVVGLGAAGRSGSLQQVQQGSEQRTPCQTQPALPTSGRLPAEEDTAAGPGSRPTRLWMNWNWR